MCEIDNDKDTKKEIESVINEKVEDFTSVMHEHGIGCGNEIAKIAKEIHPDAIAVIPLYRSCIVIEQSEKDRKEGVCVIHGYADPHWLGGEIDLENLQREDFHARFIVQGDRQGPGIYLENLDKNVDINIDRSAEKSEEVVSEDTATDLKM